MAFFLEANFQFSTCVNLNASAGSVVTETVFFFSSKHTAIPSKDSRCLNLLECSHLGVDGGYEWRLLMQHVVVLGGA